MKRRTFLKAMSLPFIVPGNSAFAQGDTSRPIRMIVPLPPGSSNDTATRIISAGPVHHPRSADHCRQQDRRRQRHRLDGGA